MITAIERTMQFATTAKTLIVIRSNRGGSNKIVKGRFIHSAVVVPSVVQLDEHVRFGRVETNFSDEAALWCFSTYKRIEASRRVAVFNSDTFCKRGRGRTY
jgi:hypothetical protein